MRRVKIHSIIVFAILINVDCSKNSEHPVCTNEFVMIRLAVVDQNGTPTDSVNITVHDAETNEVYDVSDMNFPNSSSSQNGIYTIFHDGFKIGWRGLVLELLIEGTKGSTSLKTTCTVGRDECHVFKVSGLDTVVIK